MSDKPNEPREEGDLVITPGGPRPRDLVRGVGPREAVEFDAAGAPAVVPREANSPRPGRGREEEARAGLVLTPGGFRPRSLVHEVGTGMNLQSVGGRMRLLDSTLEGARAAMVEVEEAAVALEELPALGSGWIVYTYWNNGMGRPITSFLTTWEVPPVPATSSGQTIFLFNGIQNYGENYGILQPVLQWGESAAGGGPYWTISSWYVTFNGQAFHTTLIPVNPGDVLVGAMTLTGQTGTSFSYNCEFLGISGTLLPIENIAELLWCNETLEAYSISQCSDYPDTDGTALRAIKLLTASGAAPLNWTPVNAVTDCGQHAVVVSNSPVDGEVDLFYR